MNKKLKKTLQCTMCAVLSLGMVVQQLFCRSKKNQKTGICLCQRGSRWFGIQDYRIGLAEGCK